MLKRSSSPDALEIIELASQDIEELTRAFDLITAVCAEFNQPALELSESTDLPTIH